MGLHIFGFGNWQVGGGLAVYCMCLPLAELQVYHCQPTLAFDCDIINMLELWGVQQGLHAGCRPGQQAYQQALMTIIH